MWLGAEVTRGWGDSGAEVTGAEVSGAQAVGPRWGGVEVTRGRGGSRVEVSVNLVSYQPLLLKHLAI